MSLIDSAAACYQRLSADPARRIDKREIDQNVFHFARSNSGSPRRSVRYCSQRGRGAGGAQRAPNTRCDGHTARLEKNAGLVAPRTASMFVIKKKSAKKSSEEASVKTNFLYLGGYFARVRLAYEVCSACGKMRTYAAARGRGNSRPVRPAQAPDPPGRRPPPLRTGTRT